MTFMAIIEGLGLLFYILLGLGRRNASIQGLDGLGLRGKNLQSCMYVAGFGSKLELTSKSGIGLRV